MAMQEKPFALFDLILKAQGEERRLTVVTFHVPDFSVRFAVPH